MFIDVLLKFGTPFRLHHDKGGQFENSFLYELQRLRGIARS